jgi:hypothetical protein
VAIYPALTQLLCSVVDPDPYVLGILDPHPDPLVTSTDPAPDFYCVVTSF